MFNHLFGEGHSEINNISFWRAVCWSNVIRFLNERWVWSSEMYRQITEVYSNVMNIQFENGELCLMVDGRMHTMRYARPELQLTDKLKSKIWEIFNKTEVLFYNGWTKFILVWNFMNWTRTEIGWVVKQLDGNWICTRHRKFDETVQEVIKYE